MDFESEKANLEKSSVTGYETGGGGGGGNGGEGGGGGMKWGMGPSPFLVKLYEMVEDTDTNAIISWNSTKTSFIVWDYNKFSYEILPKYFRTNIFSSFLYQLSNYGFKKISFELYEYANQWFQAGKEHWLKNIKRRKKRGRFTPDHHRSANATTDKKMEWLLTEQNDMKEQIKKLKQGQKYLEVQLASLETNGQKMDIAVLLKQFMQYLTEKKDEANGDDSKKLRSDDPPSTESSVDPTNKDEITAQISLSSISDSESSEKEQVVKKTSEIADCPFWKKMLEYNPGFNLNEQTGELDSYHSKAIMHLDEMLESNMAMQSENLMASNPCDPGMEEEDVHLELWT